MRIGCQNLTSFMYPRSLKRSGLFNETALVYGELRLKISQGP